MYHSFWYIDPDPFYELEPTEYRKNPMQICSQLPVSLPPAITGCRQSQLWRTTVSPHHSGPPKKLTDYTPVIFLPISHQLFARQGELSFQKIPQIR